MSSLGTSKRRHLDIPADSNTIQEKTKKIAAGKQTDNFSASSEWISRFKDCHGIVHKKALSSSSI
jgi:hypothetical protein